MFRTGDKIGTFNLVKKLGRGAFGVVWLAEEKTALTTHAVALKLPNDDDVDLEAIKQEAAVWEQVKGHPNILPIIKADVVENQIYIASEYAPDGSLADWLKQNGGKAASPAVAVELVRGIAAGLAHLHSKKVIHRDLKPQNILLQGDTPRIADFGIARVLKDSHSSLIAGTPAYMAPECFMGKRSELTDIWAVGVIFYQLLTGLLPYRQSDPASLMNAIINGEPKIDAELVPDALRPVILKALAKNPANRYQTAAALRDDLRRVNLSDLPDLSAVDEATLVNPTTIAQDEAAETLVQEDSRQTQEAGRTTQPFFTAVKTTVLGKRRTTFAAFGLLALAAFAFGGIYLANSGKTAVSGQINVNYNGNPTASPVFVPTDNRTLWAEWSKMLEDEKYEAVIAETTAEIERNPNNGVAYRMRATALYSKNEEERGRMDVRETLRLLANPTTAEEFEAQCYGLKKINKPDEAIESCTKAIELDSQLALAYNIRGTVYHQKKQYDLAIKDYDKAIELSPLNAVFFENRAISYEAKGGKKKAVEDEKYAELIKKSRQPAVPPPVVTSGQPTVSPQPQPTLVPQPMPKPTKIPQPRQTPRPSVLDEDGLLPEPQVKSPPRTPRTPRPTIKPAPTKTPVLRSIENDNRN